MLRMKTALCCEVLACSVFVMVNLPAWSFLIYGVSWWLALVGIATYLRRKCPEPNA